MSLVALDAWLCTDCGMIIANGDDSGIEDPAAHYAAMEAHRPADHPRTGDLVVSGCPEGDYCESHGEDTGECRFDRDFSSVQCDGCGTTLAGHRFAAAELIEESKL